MGWLKKRLVESTTRYAFAVLAISYFSDLTTDQHAAWIALAAALFLTPDKQHETR